MTRFPSRSFPEEDVGAFRASKGDFGSPSLTPQTRKPLNRTKQSTLVQGLRAWCCSPRSYRLQVRGCNSWLLTTLTTREEMILPPIRAFRVEGLGPAWTLSQALNSET